MPETIGHISIFQEGGYMWFFGFCFLFSLFFFFNFKISGNLKSEFNDDACLYLF